MDWFRQYGGSLRILSALCSAALTVTPTLLSAEDLRAIPGQYIVKIRPSERSAYLLQSDPNDQLALPSILNSSKLKVIESAPLFQSKSIGTSAYSLSSSTGSDGETFLISVASNDAISLAEGDILQELTQSPAVIWAEPNYIFHISANTNDPFLGSKGSYGQQYDDLWHIKQIEAPRAWDISRGEGVVVAVIDTGVDYTHPELKENMWKNPGEIPGNGVDDDRNGYIDDTVGWDFTTCKAIGLFGCTSQKPMDNDPMDGHGHGTHCSGTVAAQGDNKLGIVGVAPRAKIMALKGLDDVGGGTLADLASSVRYAVDNGADVISASWGGKESSAVMQEVFQYAADKGVIAIVAAGNSNEHIKDYSPAQLPTVLTIGSTDENDEKSDFSNYSGSSAYGPTRNKVIEISAPGGGSGSMSKQPNGQHTFTNILSLRSQGTDMYKGAENYKAGTFILSDPGTNNQLYYRSRGTSMATPHVSGAAAVVLSKLIRESNGFNRADVEARKKLRAEVRARLIHTADQFGSEPTSTSGAVTLGSGRLNVYRALTAQAVPLVDIVADHFEEARGNGNNIPDSNEEMKLYITLDNQWASARNVQASLSVESSELAQVTRAASKFGSLATGENKENSSEPFLIKLKKISSHTPINFRLKVSAEGTHGNFERTIPIRVFAGARKLGASAFNTAEALLGGFEPLDRPAISGDRIVWTEMGRGGKDIMMYDFSTNKESVISTKSGGAHPANQSHPALDGNLIVWQDDRNGDWDIFGKNLSDGREFSVPLASDIRAQDQKQPQVSGKNIIFTNVGEALFIISNLDIYSYNRENGSVTPLANTMNAEFNPSMGGSMAVWENSGTLGFQVITDINNIKVPLTLAPSLFLGKMWIEPDTDGKQVVFTETSLSLNGERDIYMIDMTKGGSAQNAVRITNDSLPQGFPQVSGDFITWQEKVGDYFVIRAHKISTSEKFTLSSSISNARGVVASSRYLTWKEMGVLWATQLPGTAGPVPNPDPDPTPPNQGDGGGGGESSLSVALSGLYGLSQNRSGFEAVISSGGSTQKGIKVHAVIQGNFTCPRALTTVKNLSASKAIKFSLPSKSPISSIGVMLRSTKGAKLATDSIPFSNVAQTGKAKKKRMTKEKKQALCSKIRVVR